MGNCLFHKSWIANEEENKETGRNETELYEEDFPSSAEEEISSAIHCHEVLKLEGGEADIHKHYDGCKKNPGHKDFIPLSDFTINNLTEDFKDEKLVDYIKATADLTVRVAVKMTSTQRPDWYPNTDQPYAFSDIRGSDALRLGTGIIRRVIKYQDESGKTCSCPKCLQSDSPNKVWGEVRMHTATHVVFDDLEAKHTTCRLFYDKADSPLVTVDGFKIGMADVEKDTCWLSCCVCDADLLDKLYNLWKHWRNAWFSLSKDYTLNRDTHKFNFIVSHPHGCPKQVSVNFWHSRNIDTFYMGGWVRSKYLYKTCTCPGSSGALVNTMRPHDIWLDYAHVHSGSEGEFNTTNKIMTDDSSKTTVRALSKIQHRKVAGKTKQSKYDNRAQMLRGDTREKSGIYLLFENFCVSIYNILYVFEKLFFIKI